MASISNDSNGGKRIQFVAGDGARKAIRLGKVSKRDAEGVRIKVEALLSAKLSGASGVDREVAGWLSKVDPRLLEKLRKAGLLPEEVENKMDRDKNAGLLLRELTDRFITEVGGEGKRKPGTVAQWRQVEGILLSLLPKDIAVKDITRGHATEYLEKLKKGRKALTVAKNIRIVKQAFAWAIDWELITYSPFDRLKAPAAIPKNNVEVQRGTIETILSVVDSEWRKIIALARYGGLRTPSETLSLRWENINWETGRMVIPEPKVEHHEGRGLRECPLFPELRAVLEPLREKGGYVVNKPAYRLAANTGVGWRNANLRTQFLKQIAKVNKVKGVEIKPWARLFHSLRASRQTELERQFPLSVVCAWLGNSPKVARASYLLVTEEDWKAGSGAESGAESVGKGGSESA